MTLKISPRPAEQYASQAAIMWHDFDINEKTGVRFGMFPHAKMQQAAAEGFDGKKLCVALMEIANRDGGMRA